MDTTKEQLIHTIKEWVRIDNELRILSKQQSIRKKEKQEMSESLIEIMRSNEIDCFDIKNGQIMYTKRNIKKPITQKALLNILSNYYKGNVEKAEEVNNFIMENREQVVKETIVRKIDKGVDIESA
jgi:hypothetical protein